MKIAIGQVRIDGGTQSRVAINDSAVSEYADAMTEGASLPPVTAFFDGADYWLADGFHRYHAHRRIGALNLDADVREGTRRDAMLYSVGANASHGLRRTNEDKRRAVETLVSDAEWSAWTDREIAKACGVSHPFVAAVRRPAAAEKQQVNRDKSAAKRGAAVESDSTTPLSATTPAAAPNSARNEKVVGDAPATKPATTTAGSEPDRDASPNPALQDANIQEELVEMLNETTSQLTAANAELDALRALTAADDRVAAMLSQCSVWKSCYPVAKWLWPELTVAAWTTCSGCPHWDGSAVPVAGWRGSTPGRTKSCLSAGKRSPPSCWTSSETAI